jgi:hypothetical protein
VRGSINAVTEVGGNAAEGTKQAVNAAVDAAREIGGNAVKTVEDALSTGIQGAKDIISGRRGHAA